MRKVWWSFKISLIFFIGALLVFSLLACFIIAGRMFINWISFEEALIITETTLAGVRGFLFLSFVIGFTAFTTALAERFLLS